MSSLMTSVNIPQKKKKKAWDSDFGVVLTYDRWDLILDLIHTSSTSAKHSVIQLKVLHRVHFTNARLAKIYPNLDPLCPRCRDQPADLNHMFWLCSSLSTFWTSILKAFSEIVEIQFDPDPVCALFSLTSYESRTSLPNKAHVIMAFTTLLARRFILLRWKQQAPPFLSHWILCVS